MNPKHLVFLNIDDFYNYISFVTWSILYKFIRAFKKLWVKKIDQDQNNVIKNKNKNVDLVIVKDLININDVSAIAVQVSNTGNKYLFIEIELEKKK